VEGVLMGVGDRKIFSHHRLDELRRGRGTIAEHVIDEFVAGNLSRKEFLRRGTMIGLSLPVLGAILEACRSSGTGASTPGRSHGFGSRTATGAGRSGATIRVGIIVPSTAIDPVKINDRGGAQLLGQVGEWLVFTEQHMYHPWLATSWSANADASVWTFKLRKGVRFNNGKPMTADDVVYSFKSQSDPKNNGNALSVFGGTLKPQGVVKADDYTVEFHLEAPNANFVNAVSPDNYNMIIVPDGLDHADFQRHMVATGSFVNTGYFLNQGATFVRNARYWGKPALPEKLEFTFYPDEAAMTAALEAGDIDCNSGFSAYASPQLLAGGYNVIALRQSKHLELSMRNDTYPFTSKYVRRAIALTLDRPAIVQVLFKGYADIGNDNPFAPVFGATVGPPSVPQRHQNLALARELLKRGGVPRGFGAHLFTEQLEEIPASAQILQAAAAQIGVDIKLRVESSQKYYGQNTIGSSDWLDGEMSYVDYGARNVPNLFLEAPLQSVDAKTGQGEWNAARFSNPLYDRLSKEFVATADLSTQRRLAKQIELLLLDETPIIYPYFYDGLAASQKNVHGIHLTPVGQLFFWNTRKS
jgi:peptide/nickel transport system substrate-binding protein